MLGCGGLAASSSNTKSRPLRPTRPTSLKLNDSSANASAGQNMVLRTISQKQKQLRLGVSSLIVGATGGGSGASGGGVGGGKTESKSYISRNTCCSPSLFSPYSPHSRTSMLLNSGRTSAAPPMHPPNGAALGSFSSHPSQHLPPHHAAQILPNRLTSRQSRPCSRATAVPVPVPPPTSPHGCDISDFNNVRGGDSSGPGSMDHNGAGIGGGMMVQSPTSSLLSGPFSPTSSVMSGFPPPSSDISISSPFPGLSDTQSPQLDASFGRKTSPSNRLGSPSDLESVSSQSQADSVSLRLVQFLFTQRY